jgi:hypothetical protein
MLALTPAVIWLMYGYFAPAANPDGLITAARAELAAEQQAAKVAATVRAMTGSKVVTSVRQAAALCIVSRYIVLGWIGRGLLPEPSWTLGQLQQAQEAAGPRTAPHTPHGTRARWSHGCSCTECRRAHADTLRARGRARAQGRLPAIVQQQLLDAIYAGQPFRNAIWGLGLTSNQVWRLARTDTEWSVALEAALTATLRDDLKHGTTPAYVRGCVCKECRKHQRERMARNR